MDWLASPLVLFSDVPLLLLLVQCLLLVVA
jgi:hypothetical protein